MRKFFSNLRVVEIIYILLLLIIPVQKYLQHSYNNFTIFQHSSYHFFAGTNLYLEYPKEYFDVFLYNPSYALLFVPFAYLPTLAGMFLWVGFGLALYYLSVRLLPFDMKARLFIFAFTLLELITSLENLQTNALIAAAILLTYVYIEDKNNVKASLFTNLGFFIKGYGAISGALFILKRSKFKDYLWLLFWFTVILCLPLIHYSPGGLINLYKQWIGSLLSEHSSNTGVSVMGMLSSILNLKIGTIYIQSAGLLFFLATMIFIFLKKNYDQVKTLFLAYMMIWIIIFNHDAESATYIIASTGVAIWYINSSRTWLDITFLIITFILTVLSPSDLFPSYLRRTYVFPYCLKALGPFLVWLKIQFNIFFPEKKQLKIANG
ncbi:MAG: glycosyltransferase family 87 protein [Bacteroidales bacterium]